MKIARAAVCLLVVGAIAATVSYAALPLTGRVLHSDELAGMTINGPDRVTTSAGAWVTTTDSPHADVARLRKLGFVAGVDESLIGKQNLGGISIVEQFPSAKSAKTELAYETTVSGPWTYFPVQGIPSARGFEHIGNSGNGRNVAFTDGVYYYLVGAGWSGESTSAISRSATIAAALVLYHRVYGK